MLPDKKGFDPSSLAGTNLCKMSSKECITGPFFVVDVVVVVVDVVDVVVLSFTSFSKTDGVVVVLEVVVVGVVVDVVRMVLVDVVTRLSWMGRMETASAE